MKIGGVTIKRVSPNDIRIQADPTNWNERQIRGSEKGTVALQWLGLIPLILFGSFVLWRIHMEFFIAKHVPNPFLCILAILIVFGAYKALWETVRLKRFGDPMLELNAVPVPLGGSVEGRVTIASGMDKAPEFSVTLACLHRTVTRGSKSDHVHEKVLWSAENKASLMLGGILPISIAVPSDQPPTNRSNFLDGIFWRLTVKARFLGPAFLEKYEIPVGKAPDLATSAQN